MENWARSYEFFQKKAKSLRFLAILGLVFAGCYLMMGLASLIISIIPMPLIGIAISLILTGVELSLLAAAMAVNVIALIKSIGLKKDIQGFEDAEEFTALLRKGKTNVVLSIIGVSVTAIAGVLVIFLGVFEFVVMFI